MATYIMMSTLTDEGRKTLKERPERLKEVNKEVATYSVDVVLQAENTIKIIARETGTEEEVVDIANVAFFDCAGPVGSISERRGERERAGPAWSGMAPPCWTTCATAAPGSWSAPR